MILNTTVIFHSLWSFSNNFLYSRSHNQWWSMKHHSTVRTMTRSRRKRFIEDPKFDVFLNPTKRKKQDEIVKNLTKKFQKVTGMLMLMVSMMLLQPLMLFNLNIIVVFVKVFKSMDLVQSYPALFQVLWHSINPCFDIRWTGVFTVSSETFTVLNIYLNLLDFRHWTSTYRDQKSTIKRCKWKVDFFEEKIYDNNNAADDDGNIQGMDINCTAIFKTNPTDRGMCCTFNALAAEEIYRWSWWWRWRW